MAWNSIHTQVTDVCATKNILKPYCATPSSYQPKFISFGATVPAVLSCLTGQKEEKYGGSILSQMVA